MRTCVLQLGHVVRKLLRGGFAALAERDHGLLLEHLEPGGDIASDRRPGRRIWTVRRRSWAAMARVQAAWTTGAKPIGTTNMVRRMPSMRSRTRSSYSASSMSVTAGRWRVQTMDR